MEVDKAVAAAYEVEWELSYPVMFVLGGIGAAFASAGVLGLAIIFMILFLGYILFSFTRWMWESATRSRRAARVRLEGDDKIRQASRQVERLARELVVAQENAAAARKACEARTNRRRSI